MKPLEIAVMGTGLIGRRDATPLVSGREGLATLRVVEAMKRSASAGKMIHLSESLAT